MVIFMTKNENKEDATMGAKTEMVQERSKIDVSKVKPIQIRLGKYAGGWDISIPGRGTRTYGPNDLIKLNPYDEFELRAILGVIKEVNRRSSNAWMRVNNKQTGETERAERFVIESGLEGLPEVLQKHSYTASGGYTDEEIEAIKVICPKFRFEKMRPHPLMGTGM